MCILLSNFLENKIQIWHIPISVLVTTLIVTSQWQTHIGNCLSKEGGITYNKVKKMSYRIQRQGTYISLEKIGIIYLILIGNARHFFFLPPCLFFLGLWLTHSLLPMQTDFFYFPVFMTAVSSPKFMSLLFGLIQEFHYFQSQVPKDRNLIDTDWVRCLPLTQSVTPSTNI